MNIFQDCPLIFLVDIKLMDVKLMPFAVENLENVIVVSCEKYLDTFSKNLRITNYDLRLRRERSVERLRKS